MVKCRYCGREFNDESANREHLRETHSEELGPIDRRRLESEEEERSRTPLVLAGVVLVLALGIMAGAGYVLLNGGGSGGNADASGSSQASLPENGDQALLQDVQQYPSQGTEHVAEGTDLNYQQMPPTSGTHYSSTIEAGFYENPQPLGSLVHSLEHGAVVVYYDPQALTPEARQYLEQLATRYTGTWSSVIVAPNPTANPDAPYVVTAWRHELTMSEFDRSTVRAFLAEYLGRGPENPVR